MLEAEEQEAQIRSIRGMRKLTSEQFDALVGLMAKLDLRIDDLEPLDRNRRVAVNVQLSPEDWQQMQLKALKYGLPGSQMVRLLVLSWLADEGGGSGEGD